VQDEPLGLHSTVDIPKGFDDLTIDVPVELRKKWEGQGAIGAWELWSRKSPAELLGVLPFAGTVSEAVGQKNIGDAMSRLVGGDYVDPAVKVADKEAVKKFFYSLEEKRVRGISTGGLITDQALSMPAYALEIFSSLGVGGLAKLSAEIGFKAAMGKGMVEAIKIYEGRGMKARLATAALGAPLGAGAHIPEQFFARQNMTRLTPTAKGAKILEQNPEAPYTALMKASASALTDYFSEFSGEGIARGLKFVGKPVEMAVSKIFPARLANITAQVYAKIQSTRLGRIVTSSEITQFLRTQAGYDGMISEMGEEGLAALMKAAGNYEDLPGPGMPSETPLVDRIMNTKPEIRDLAIMGGSFILGGGIMRAGVSRLSQNKETRIVAPEELTLSEEELNALAAKITAPVFGQKGPSGSTAAAGAKATAELNEAPASSLPDLAAKLTQKAESNLANPARIAHNKEQMRVLDQMQKTLRAKLQSELAPEVQITKNKEALDEIQGTREKLQEEMESAKESLKNARSKGFSEEAVLYQESRIATLQKKIRAVNQKMAIHQAAIKAASSGGLTARATQTQASIAEVERQRQAVEEETMQLLMHPEMDSVAIGARNIDTAAVNELQTVQAQITEVEAAVQAGDGKQTLRLQELLNKEAELQKKIEASVSTGKVKVQMTGKEIQKLEKDMLSNVLHAVAQGFKLGTKESLAEAKRLQGIMIRAIEESGLDQATKGRYARRIAAIQTPVQAEKFLPNLLGDLDRIIAARDLTRARNEFWRVRSKALKLSQDKRSTIGGKEKAAIKEFLGKFADYAPFDESLQQMEANKKAAIEKGQADLAAVLAGRVEKYKELEIEGAFGPGMQNIRDMDASDIQRVTDELSYLLATGRTRQQDKKAEQHEFFTLTRDTLAAKIKDVFKNPFTPEEQKAFSKLWASIKSIDSSVLSTATFCKLLDRVGKVGPWMKLMGLRIENSITVWQELDRKIQKKVNNIVQKHYEKLHAVFYNSKFTFKNGVTGAIHKLTGMNMVAIYANSKHKDNYSALVGEKGMGYSDSEILEIISSIPETVRKTVDEIQLDVLAPLGLDVQKITEVMSNIWLKLAEPGTYWPKTRDNDISPLEASTDVKNLYAPQRDVLDMRPGATYRRSQAAYSLDLDDPFKVLSRHISEMTHYIATAEVIQDSMQLVEDPELRAEIIRAIGKENYAQFRSTIATIATGPQKSKTGLERGFRRSISHMSKQVIGAVGINLTAIGNLASYADAVKALGMRGKLGSDTKAGVKFLRRGILGMLHVNKGDYFPILSMIKEINRLMPGMSHRYDTFKGTIAGILDGESVDYLRRYAGREGIPAQAMDLIVWGTFKLADAMVSYPLALAAYHQAKTELDLPIDQAVAYAQDLVESSQGSYRLNHMGTAFTKGPLGKAIVQLFNYSGSQYQLNKIIMNDAQARTELEGWFSIKGGVTVASSMVSLFALGVLIPAIYNMLLRVPEEEWSEERLLEELLKQLMSLIPYGRGLTDAGLALAQGKKTRELFGALGPFKLYGENGAKLINSITDFVKSEGEDSGKLWETMVAALNIAAVSSRRLSAVPMPALERFMEASYDLNQGETEDWRQLFFPKHTLSKEEE
jgi:hypothetical protein